MDVLKQDAFQWITSFSESFLREFNSSNTKKFQLELISILEFLQGMDPWVYFFNLTRTSEKKEEEKEEKEEDLWICIPLNEKNNPTPFLPVEFLWVAFCACVLFDAQPDRTTLDLIDFFFKFFDGYEDPDEINQIFERTCSKIGNFRKWMKFDTNDNNHFWFLRQLDRHDIRLTRSMYEDMLSHFLFDSPSRVFGEITDLIETLKTFYSFDIEELLLALGCVLRLKDKDLLNKVDSVECLENLFLKTKEKKQGEKLYISDVFHVSWRTMHTIVELLDEKEKQQKSNIYSQWFGRISLYFSAL